MYDDNAGSKKRRLKKKMLAIKELGGMCSRCFTSYKDVEVYDFHHEDEGVKEYSLANMWAFSWDRIREELGKCVLLCANCHRILHKEERDDE